MTTIFAAPHALTGSNPFAPGVWTLLVVVGLIGLAVLIAMKDRRQRASVKETLDASSWTIECMEPGNPRVRRMLVLDDEGLAIVEVVSRQRESYPWAEIGMVSQKPMRSRMGSYPGIQISMVNGHSRDLLVVAPLVQGRRMYQVGAAEAEEQIEHRLRQARERQPEDPRLDNERSADPPTDRPEDQP